MYSYLMSSAGQECNLTKRAVFVFFYNLEEGDRPLSVVSNCALYISPNELNELVMNRLASLGLLNRNEGICTYKHIALCMGRNIFENSQARGRH